MVSSRRFICIFLFASISMNLITAQDWPNLNRFKAENDQLSKPKAGEKRVVFMGNSITEGWSSMLPEFFEGKPYINRGISGQTTPQMLLRFRQDVINLEPKLVVILVGTNDIAGNTGPMTLDEIMNNIKSMAELAASNNIEVILCSVLPVFDYPWHTGLNPASKIVTLNKMIHDYAVSKNYFFLDYHTATKDDRNGLPKDLAEDGVHPTKKGYKIMAELAQKMINRILDN